MRQGIKIAKQRYETEGREGGKKEGREGGGEGGRQAVHAWSCMVWTEGCLFKEERKEKKNTRFGGLGRELRKSFPEDLNF